MHLHTYSCNSWEQLSCKRVPGNCKDSFSVVLPHASAHRLQLQWQSKELPSKVDLVDLEVSYNWPYYNSREPFQIFTDQVPKL